MTDTLTIPARFRGPPTSGNGGYVAGAIAALLRTAPAVGGPAVEVTLRAPVPLDQPMTVERGDPLRVHSGDTLIAEARTSTLDLDVPEPPTFAAALAARPASPSFDGSVMPELPGATGFHPVCVCCAADLPAGESLRVHAAPVPGFDGVAAAWEPPPAFAEANGCLGEAILWTALDCPGQFAWLARGIRTGLLGRMTAQLLRPVRADDDLRVVAWTLGVERKKHFAATALFDGEGGLCAWARQIWIGRRD